LPRDRRQLSEVFEGGVVPASDELQGEYAVEILTGIVPNGRRFGHRKRFAIEQGVRQTYNVLFRDWRFGHFRVRDPEPDESWAVFDYNDERNTVLRRMRDHVRRIDDGAYLGKYNFFIGGRLRFVGFFSMIKM
jgi:hypothetical protein